MADNKYDIVKVKTKSGEMLELNNCTILLDDDGIFVKGDVWKFFVPSNNIGFIEIKDRQE